MKTGVVATWGGIVVSKFELQLHDDIQVWNITLKKSMKFLMSQTMGEI